MSAPRKATGGHDPDGTVRFVTRAQPFRDHAGASALAVWQGVCRPLEGQLPLRHPYNFVVYFALDELPSAADFEEAALNVGSDSDDRRPAALAHRLYERLCSRPDPLGWGIAAYFLPRDTVKEIASVAAHYEREKAHRRDLPIPAPDPERDAKAERDEPWPIMENYGGGPQDYRDFALIVEGTAWEQDETLEKKHVRMWFAVKGQGVQYEEDDGEVKSDTWVRPTRINLAGTRMDGMFTRSRSWDEEKQREWERVQEGMVPWR